MPCRNLMNKNKSNNHALRRHLRNDCRAPEVSSLTDTRAKQKPIIIIIIVDIRRHHVFFILYIMFFMFMLSCSHVLCFMNCLTNV